MAQNRCTSTQKAEAVRLKVQRLQRRGEESIPGYLQIEKGGGVRYFPEVEMSYLVVANFKAGGPEERKRAACLSSDLLVFRTELPFSWRFTRCCAIYLLSLCLLLKFIRFITIFASYI